MRIGHTGAGGTGKTTTAQLVAAQLGVPYRHGVAREVYAERSITETSQHQMSDQDRWDLQRTILLRKFEQDQNPNNRNAVFDRTPLDHLAYCLFRCNNVIGDQELKGLEAAVAEGTKGYDLVVYHPAFEWAMEIPGDGLRENTRAYRTIIDALIKGLLHRLQIPHVVVPDAAPNQVAFAVTEFLRIKREGAPLPNEARARPSSTEAGSKADPPTSPLVPVEKDGSKEVVGETESGRSPQGSQPDAGYVDQG